MSLAPPPSRQVTSELTTSDARPVVVRGPEGPASGRAAAPPGPQDAGPRPRPDRLGYLPGLDGLRALAVVGVIVYHLDPDWLPGGFLGVDVFFVLSGFLISSLLLEELGRRGAIDFRGFYLRRARRLLPALFLVLGFVVLAAATVARDAAAQVRTDLPPSVFFSLNWWYVLSEQSYFQAIGRPPLLQHLWSLGVEEQFYLLWPVALLGAWTWRRRRGVLAVAAVGALASTALMAFLSVSHGYPGNDASRAYFGTDTHAMGLLVGAALATLWRPGRLPRRVAPGAQAVITGVGLLALVGVLVAFALVDQYSAALYRGGFLVLAVVVAALIAAASHPAGRLGGWLGSAVPRYLGQRSYGLYLWHWPIFMLTRPGLDVPGSGPLLTLGRVGLLLTVAELSYRFVEMPVRRGELGAGVRRLRDCWRGAGPAVRASLGLRAGAVAATGVLAVGWLGSSLLSAPAPSAADVAGLDGITSLSADAPPVSEPPPAPDRSSLGRPAAAPRPSPVAPVPGAVAPSRAAVTVLGDSVVIGARNGLRSVLPNVGIDAAIGRQSDELIARVRSLARQGDLAPVVVLHVGTNGIVTPNDLRDMIEAAGQRRVVVVNSAGPHVWQGYSDRTIVKVAPRYRNVVVVDWRAATTGHPEYFINDGVHLTPAGITAFSRLVGAAVAR